MNEFQDRVSLMVHCTITDNISLRELHGWYTVLDFHSGGLTIGSLPIPKELEESPVLHEEISALLKPMGFIDVEFYVWEREKSLPF